MTDPSSIEVLVVDDEPDLRLILTEMLKIIGYTKITCAADGSEAIDILTKKSIKLILSDWEMPKINGLGVLKFVRSHPIIKNVPFIMFSGYVPEDIIAEAAETEVDAYMLKPFSLDDLRNKINKVLNVGKKPSSFEQHMASGKAYRMTGQYDKAIPQFEQALKINPNSPRVFHEMGLCHDAQGDAMQGRRYFEKAIELSPKFLKAHESIAKQYFKEGNTEKYLHHLEKMSEISPRNIDRNIVIGKTMAKCGKAEEAKKILIKTMKYANEQHADVAEKIGDVFLDIGAPQLAEESFSKALLANPKSLLSFNRLGIIYRRQKKYDKAVETYQKGLEASPNNENMMHNLAIAYHESGQEEMAISVLKKALLINPEFKEAKVLLSAYQSIAK